MNFRQRLAWIIIFIYLCCGCYVVYYIFDEKGGYTAVTNIQDDSSNNRITKVYYAIPSHIWFIIGVSLYLVFFVILLTLTAANLSELLNHVIDSFNIFKKSKPNLQRDNQIRIT